MRPPVDAEQVHRLARLLGRAAHERVRLYLTGGATAVIEGWRPSTIDVDLRIEPEIDDVLRALPRAKEELSMNIELAAPPDFIPELPGWRERSPFLFREDQVDVHHFDPYSQALSKIERDFEQDRSDVRDFVRSGMVELPRLLELFAAIEAHLYRYPAIDPAAFRRRVEAVVRTRAE